jgi:peroxidase
VTLANLPAPSSKVTTLIKAFATKNLNVTDLVALSGIAIILLVASQYWSKCWNTIFVMMFNSCVEMTGGHTIGIGHCTSFTDRLYPKQDTTLNKSFAQRLYTACPSKTSSNTTVLDIRTPNVFDNKYYVDLMNRQGLFTSDQDLYSDSRTKAIVNDFALDQDLFFEKFAVAMVKMGQLNVLTGSKGEIRSNCSVSNLASASTVEVAAEDVIESYASFM